MKVPRLANALVSTVVLAAAAVSLVAVVVGVAEYVTATRPLSEGVFLSGATSDAARTYRRLRRAGRDDATIVRLIRNRLDAAAVGIVDDRGRYVASTSPTLTTLDDSYLLAELDEGRFGAAAQTLSKGLLIDGVAETEPGAVVYTAVRPLGDGRGVVTMFTIPELRRRTIPISHGADGALDLVGLGVLSGVLATGLAVHRIRTRRRQAAMRRETEELRERSEELEALNRELETAQAETLAALAEAEEANRVRSEFALMITHELRTPLTSVVTGAELLRGTELSDADRDQILDDLVADARRLRRLIAQMLTVARVESDGFDAAPAAVTPEQLARELTHCHPRLSCDPEVLPDVVVETDPEVLATLLGSLADNALTHGASRVWLEASDELGFDPMQVVGDLDGDRLYLVVADDGPGIDPEFLPRAFEKFAKHGSSPGTGLGLYLARLMADSIDAAIAVATGPEGTRMAVAVPLAGDRLEVAS